MAAFVPLTEIVKLVNLGTLFAFVPVNVGVVNLGTLFAFVPPALAPAPRRGDQPGGGAARAGGARLSAPLGRSQAAVTTSVWRWRGSAVTRTSSPRLVSRAS